MALLVVNFGAASTVPESGRVAVVVAVVVACLFADFIVMY
jgi:hypothetical protein